MIKVDILIAWIGGAISAGIYFNSILMGLAVLGVSYMLAPHGK